MVAAMPAAGPPAGFVAEVEKTEQDIALLEDGLAQAPRDIEKGTRLAYRLYHRATLVENAQAYLASEKAIQTAISLFGPQEDLCLLKANLDFRFHRIAAAEEDLRMAPKLCERPEARSLAADLAFQRGRYEEAHAAYEALIGEARTWDNLARLAHYTGKMGDLSRADQLYAEAEDELTAKEMRSFAWLELQRGVLHASRGCYENATVHYERAGRAYPGYPSVHEHRAEVLGATKEYDAAAALYLQLVERTRKPELMQALGELLVCMGDAQRARSYFERALVAYLESAERGEVHYYHHLTDLYADVLHNGDAAVEWARRDLELRQNFSTQAALAWALYRAGGIEEAERWMDVALASGAVSAELFHQAAAIYRAAGRAADSDRWLSRATAVNPRFGVFHVHR